LFLFSFFLFQFLNRLAQLHKMPFFIPLPNDGATIKHPVYVGKVEREKEDKRGMVMATLSGRIKGQNKNGARICQWPHSISV
jgi:hypothetical protein